MPTDEITSFPLTEERAGAYRDALARAGRGPFAFIGIHPQDEKVPGFHGALGLAVANERGYTPVPFGWARYTSQDAAADHADILNRFLGLDPDTEVRIVISTMGGRRFIPETAPA